MNKIILIGNLTRDPESGTTSAGISYCRFGLAVNRRFSKEQTETDFFNIVTWRGLADTCGRVLSKGRKVAITGSVQIRNYDAQDGSKRTSVDVVADEVEFLSPRGEGGEPQAPVQRRDGDVSELTPVQDESLPF